MHPVRRKAARAPASGSAQAPAPGKKTAALRPASSFAEVALKGGVPLVADVRSASVTAGQAVTALAQALLAAQHRGAQPGDAQRLLDGAPALARQLSFFAPRFAASASPRRPRRWRRRRSGTSR